MALDGAYLYTIRQELLPLVGAHLEKIYQPAREELLLSFRDRQGSHKVICSCAADRARVHLTEISVENPKTPPMFCMLLRKHLIGGKLTDLRQVGLERVLYFDFSCTNALGDPVIFTLACEIMGKYSNIILLDGNGVVVDSIKRVDSTMSSKRLVLPGVPYAMPPKNERLNFLEAQDVQIRETVTHKTGDLSKVLISCFEGISPILAREWVHYAGQGKALRAESMTETQLDRLCFYIHRTREILETGQETYTMVKTLDGVPKDFSFIPLHQFGSGVMTIEVTSACALLDAFYADRDQRARMKQRANDLFHVLLQNTERIRRRIAAQSEELGACAHKDTARHQADLLTSNLYALQKGDSVAHVVDFYDPECPTIDIPLDPQLTPSQNAQKYYQSYKKACTAEKALTAQIAKGEEELTYLDSVLDALTRAETENDLDQIREELSEQGYLRQTKQKNKPEKAAPPMMFTASNGMRIFVGRNNRQNDILTLKTAQKNDLWFHTQNIPGSHVILESHGEMPSQSVLVEVAEIAAYYSKARQSSQVPVDYCPVRYVKKPVGAKPGMVIFSNQHTLYVTPHPPEEKP